MTGLKLHGHPLTFSERVRGRLFAWYAQHYFRYRIDFVFVHINKTGGTSIEQALGLPLRHRTATELRAQLGERIWTQRFKFAFVRNPWSRVASQYFYRVKTHQTNLGTNPIPFQEWVARAYEERDPQFRENERMFQPQVDWISDEAGNFLVDFIGRFEQLERDFTVVCSHLGRTASLPHAKKSFSRDHQDVYDERTAQIIAEAFAPDIEAFGYDFSDR